MAESTCEQGTVREEAFRWPDRARVVVSDLVLGKRWSLEPAPASRATMAP